MAPLLDGPILRTRLYDDPAMRWVLYLNTWALLFVTVWFLARRWRLAEARADAEAPEPLPEAAV